ncbi:PhzF family phenazine biosynthesis protein [Kutzneria sp. 744]|uniref:PhzF family phenazine biosynthesis protein n=1 Tax=Kutzneria sp. (strain 744) TaxID=345341 RepID=UPI0018DB8E63|nr:PhzF family phenazine biosynthesis isomerase [Kutzneria sp. 744]
MTTDVLRYAAFTTTPAGGNPAGVVLDATGLDEADQQKIAAEVGYSETAFVTRAEDGYRVRYFSPLAEVAFCGHATIATAVALAERDGHGPLLFHTQAGEIPVTTTLGDDGLTRASLTSVPTSSREATPEEIADALVALRWSTADLSSQHVPHVAFSGNHHLILVLASRARLASLSYDFDRLTTIMTRFDWTTVQLLWPESDTVWHSRNPFPVGGVVEDPATGSAAAAFGGYLLATGRVTEPVRLTLRQGEDMGRPSLLTVDLDPADPRVTVSGNATRLTTGGAGAN